MPLSPPFQEMMGSSYEGSRKVKALFALAKRGMVMEPDSVPYSWVAWRFHLRSSACEMP